MCSEMNQKKVSKAVSRGFCVYCQNGERTATTPATSISLLCGKNHEPTMLPQSIWNVAHFVHSNEDISEWNGMGGGDCSMDD